MEREVELEHRALDASTALARIQVIYCIICLQLLTWISERAVGLSNTHTTLTTFINIHLN